MVSIFTGLGAGFERGSGAALGAGGLLGGSGLGRGGEGVFLNAATGNLILQRQDEFLVGRGPDIGIARTYNSLGALDDNGDYWRQSTDRRIFGLTGTINTTGSTVKRVSADGSEITYTWNGSHYATTDSAGAHDKLTHSAGVWTWTDGSSQTKETYAAAETDVWRIASVIDSDGNTLAFTYVSGSPTKLSRVTTQDGSYLEYAWSGSNIASIVTGYTDLATSTAKTITRTTYGYDGSNRLSTVTVDLTPDNLADAASYTTTYTYDGASNRIASITQTDGSSLAIAYTYDDVTQTYRVSQLTQSVAANDTRVTTLAYFSDRTEVTDPRGSVTKLYYDANKQLTKVVAPAAQAGATPQEVLYEYDTAGSVTKVTDAGGGITDYTYDSAGNVSTIEDPLGNVTERFYDSNNNLIRESRTGSTGSSASTALHTRYVYDGENHLRYVISAEGRVSEYRYSDAGELLATIDYPQHTYTLGSTPPTLGEMNTWRDGLGDRSSTGYTQFIYDARGNLSDTYRYGGSNASGAPVNGEGYTLTHLVHDQAGRLLSRYVQGQQTESFVYDGMGRLTASSDLAGGTTTIVFNDGANTTAITTAAGYVTVSTYNKAGELISSVDSGSYVSGGTQSYLYDKNGQLRVLTDATGRKSYFVYDKTGKKIADIGHDGQVVEYRYDQAGRLVATARLYNKVSAGTLTSLADPTSEIDWTSTSIRPTAHAWDIWQWSVYDAANRVIGTIAGDGAVTKYEYDAAGRLVKTLGYYNKLSGATVSAYMTTSPATLTLPTADTNRDVVIRSFYDADGRMIGALNADGALSKITYDGAGRKVQETSYFNLTNASLRASGTFDQLLASFSADANKDVTTRYVYDGQGLLRFTIDALNRVTEYVYRQGTDGWASGLVRRTIAYAAPLGSVANYSYATIKNAVASLASSTNDRTSYAVYNDRGQLAYSVDAVGAVTGFSYDSSGRVTRTTQYASLATMSSMGTDAQWKANLDAWATSNGTGARITRTYYAARGEARFIVDAEGYVTRNDYDAQGRLFDVYRYATAIAATDSTTLANVDAANKGANARTMYRYDNMGRLYDVYDGNGTRRTTTYYANGEVSLEIVANGQGVDEQRTQYIYNQAGRLVTTRAYRSEIGNASLMGATTTLLTQAQRIASGNSQHSALLTREGELRIYHKGEVLWASGSREVVAGATYRLVAETNGNLVIYRDVSGQSAVAIWNSGTAGAHSGATFLQMQDDGNLVLHKGTAPTSTGTIWSTGTAGLVASDPNATDQIDTTFAYDGLGNLLSTTDFNGVTTAFTYDKAGRVLTRVDASGTALARTTTFEYDTFGRGVRSVDALNNASYAYFDRLGRVTLAIEAMGYATETTYTVFGEVGSVIRRMNATTGAAVGAPPTISTNAADATTSFEYDKLGRATKTTDARGAYEQYTLDAFGQRTAVRNKIGGWTDYVYDKRGLVTSETIWFETYNGPTSKRVTNAFAYDSRGNLITKTEALGLAEERVTTYAYDAADRLISKSGEAVSVATSAIGGLTPDITPTEYFYYDRRGNLIEKKDAAGARTLLWYDKLDRVTHQLSAGGTLTRHWYDKNGNVVETRTYETLQTLPADAKGLPPSGGASAYRVTQHQYDALNRLTKTIVPNITTATYTNALAVSSGNLETSYSYDAMNNVVLVTDPRGSTTWSFYDKLGRKTAQIDAGLYRTDWTYDANGNVLSERRYAQPVSSALSAPNVNILRGGDLTQGAYVLAENWNTAGGSYARALETVDGAQALTLRRIGGEIFSGAWTQPNWAWGGDARTNGGESADGRFVVVAGESIGYAAEIKQLATGPLKVWANIYFFDAAGQQVGTGGWQLLEGDAWERIAGTATVPAGAVFADVQFGSIRTDGVTNAAMDFGIRKIQVHRLASSNDAVPAWTAPTVSADDRLTTLTYDKMGRRLTEARANVAVHNGTGGTNSVTATITYTYNALSQVLSKTEATGDAIAYTYDLGGRMTREQRSAFTDVNGASVTPTVEYEYNGLNNLTLTRALGAGGTITAAERTSTYAYDSAGRLASVTDAEGFKRSYVYDATGRVVREEYNRINFTAAANEAVGYDYDLEGRIVQQGIVVPGSGSAWTRSILNGSSQETNATVVMHYNAFGEVYERGVNGLYAEKFEYDGAGRLVHSNAGDGVWKYFMYDGAGNQTLLIQSSGTDLNATATDTLSEVLALWANHSAIGTAYVAGVVATITKYDARNQAVEVREPQRELTATTRADLITTRAYNAFGEVDYEINAGGSRFDYTYNTMGRLTKVLSPSVQGVGENGQYINGYNGTTYAPVANSVTATTFRPEEHRSYDVSGRLVASRDANGNLTRMTLLAGTGYGGSEALVAETIYADGGAVRMRYDIHGDARRIEDQLYNSGISTTAHATQQTFDKLGRLIGMNRSNLLTEFYAYDGLGQRIKHWNSFYNASWNIATNPSGAGAVNAESIAYDAQGRVTQVIAPGGDTTGYAYAWNESLVTTGLSTTAFGGWTQVTTYANAKTLTEHSDVYGHAVQKIDLGGHTSDFTYDKAGRRTQQTGGSVLNYSYFNTGRLSSTTTTIAGGTRTATLGYDELGNLTIEKLQSLGQQWENATATYDALGRLTTWVELGSAYIPAGSVSYDYDANGNIRRSVGTVGVLDQNGNATQAPSDYWYKYDAMNRVVLQRGQMQSGAIVINPWLPGIEYAYDAAGQRAYSMSVYLDDVTWNFVNRREDYVYDALGQLTAVKIGDAIQPTMPQPNTIRSTFAYDALGRITQQTDYEANGTTVAYSRAVTYNTKGQISSETTDTKRGSKIYRAVSTYAYGAGSAYALGAPVSIAAANYENGVFKRNTSTTNSYQWWDSALQSTIQYKPDSAQSTTHTTTYGYEVIGGQAQLVSANIQDGRPRVVSYRNDVYGQVVRRDEVDNISTSGDPHELWYRFGGRQMSFTGNNWGAYGKDFNGTIAERQAAVGTGPFRNGESVAYTGGDVDTSLNPINSYSQGSTAGTYSVRGGDTLSGIAERLWGDASLWYNLAEANGLTSDAGLVDGQVLQIPAGVIKNTHNATTFRPYDPLEVLGNTSPTTPKVPKDKKGCGGFGQILLTVVAIAVVAIVAPHAIAAIANLGGGSAVSSVAVAKALAAGVSVATAGASTTAAVVGGALAGAAGSIASQALGVATGIQDKFSWNAVALAAIGGGVGNAGSLGIKNLALRQALGNALTQGVGVAVGAQDKFDWAGVASAALGPMAASRAANAVSGAFASNVAARSAAVIADAGAHSLIDGSDFGDNILAALPNVIGQTIGEAIAGSMTGRGANRTGAPDTSKTPQPSLDEALAPIPELDAMLARSEEAGAWADGILYGDSGQFQTLGWTDDGSDLWTLTTGAAALPADLWNFGERLAGGAIRIGTAELTAGAIMLELSNRMVERAQVMDAMDRFGLSQDDTGHLLAARAYVWASNDLKSGGRFTGDGTPWQREAAAQAVMLIELSNPGTAYHADLAINQRSTAEADRAALTLLQLAAEGAIIDAGVRRNDSATWSGIIGAVAGDPGHDRIYRARPPGVAVNLQTSSARARAAVAGQITSGRWQAHHLVPAEVWGSFQILAQLAYQDDWRVDAPSNLIALPADRPGLLPQHLGSHPDYNRAVDLQIGARLAALGHAPSPVEAHSILRTVSTINRAAIVVGAWHPRVH